MRKFKWLILILIIFLIEICPKFGFAQQENFFNDCSANDRLRCKVEQDTCASNDRSDDPPSPPYDFRVSPYLVANPHRKPDSYQLHVNFTWKPTHDGTINKTTGFELTIMNKDTDWQRCFTLRLENPIWDERDAFESGRFRFVTIDLLDYAHSYYVELQSLPKPLNQTRNMKNQNRENFISQEITTPGHPEAGILSPEETATMFCNSDAAKDVGVGNFKNPSHPHASRWVAAFRYVYIQPKNGWIFVDFIAAPPQYCFEEYELQLINEKNHILQTARVQQEDLIHEKIGEMWVAYGNFTFHNVSVGFYEVAVMPSAFARDGRCLCPMANRICTCSKSIWPDVEMPAPPTIIAPANPCDYLPPVKLPFDCPDQNRNASITNGIAVEIDTDDGSGSKTGVFIGLFFLAILVIALGILILVFFCRRYKRKGAPRMYLLPLTNTETDMAMNGTSREMSTILHPINLTVIYSHDSPEYDRLVREFVNYLNAQCYCDVKFVDFLSSKEISMNKFDWAFKSIQSSDRILILNSYGAFMRYQAKLASAENEGNSKKSIIIERSNPTEFDDLFLLQLDLINQELQRNPNFQKSRKFIPIKFEFIDEKFLLPHSTSMIRYELPKHFRSLVLDLHRFPSNFQTEIFENNNGIAVDDEAVPIQLRKINEIEFSESPEGRKLKESMELMKNFIHSKPDWFENLHVRKVIGGSNHVIGGDRWLSKIDENPDEIATRDEKIDNFDAVKAATAKIPLLNGEIESENSKDDENSDDLRNRIDSIDSGVAVSSSKKNRSEIFASENRVFEKWRNQKFRKS